LDGRIVSDSPPGGERQSVARPLRGRSTAPDARAEDLELALYFMGIMT